MTFATGTTEKERKPQFAIAHSQRSDGAAVLVIGDNTLRENCSFPTAFAFSNFTTKTKGLFRWYLSNTKMDKTGPLHVMIVLQALVLCQAYQNGSTSIQQNASLPEESEPHAANQTKLYIPQLSNPCSGPLSAFHGEAWLAVSLPPESRISTADHICENLGCGKVFEISEQSTAQNTSCLTECTYQNGYLENCTLAAAKNCMALTNIVCGNLAVRLVDSEGRCAGRVELWASGQWGTLCDDEWDLQDANVVCAQLGCGYALQVTGQGGPYGPGRGPIHLDDINCTGTESSLWDCPNQGLSNDCGHKEDAGVVCSEFRALRLTGGGDHCSGRVEIHRNGTWGTVCDNGWGRDEAHMVCTMLDCGVPVQFSAFLSPFTHNNVSWWFYFCLGSHKELWECKEYVNVKHLCKDSNAAGVICNKSLGLLPSSTAPPIPFLLSLTTDSTVQTSSQDNTWFNLSPPKLGCIALSSILFVVLIINAVLCIRCKKRDTLSIQMRNGGPRSPAECQNNEYEENANLVKINTGAAEYDAHPNPTFIVTQSSVDNSSFDSEFENNTFSVEPVVTMSTFQNSLRSRTVDKRPMAKAFALDHLPEEAPADNSSTWLREGYSDTNMNHSPSVDSFESSSTSSDECYMNSGNSKPLLPEETLVVHHFDARTTDRMEQISNSYQKQLHPLDNFKSGDPLYAASNESYENTDRELEQLYSPVQNSSESDYDDIANYRQ